MTVNDFFNDTYHHYVKFDDIARVSRIRNFAKMLEFYFCKKTLRNSRKYYRDFPDELRKNLAVQFTAIRIEMDPKLGKTVAEKFKKAKNKAKVDKAQYKWKLGSKEAQIVVSCIDRLYEKDVKSKMRKSAKSIYPIIEDIVNGLFTTAKSQKKTTQDRINDRFYQNVRFFQDIELFDKSVTIQDALENKTSILATDWVEKLDVYVNENPGILEKFDEVV